MDGQAGRGHLLLPSFGIWDAYLVFGMVYLGGGDELGIWAGAFGILGCRCLSRRRLLVRIGRHLLLLLLHLLLLLLLLLLLHRQLEPPPATTESKTDSRLTTSHIRTKPGGEILVKCSNIVQRNGIRQRGGNTLKKWEILRRFPSRGIGRGKGGGFDSPGAGVPLPLRSPSLRHCNHCSSPPQAAEPTTSQVRLR